MKKAIFITLMLLFINVSVAASASEQTERVLIMFKDTIEDQLLHDYGVEVHYTFDHLQAVSATIPASIRETLEQNEAILQIEEDAPVKTSGQISNGGYEHIGADEAHKKGWTGKGVKVGIIDTGVRMDHPDLKLAGGVSFVKNSRSYHDDEGHGTHVAGIIGALQNGIGTVGIAPDAELYAIKALDHNGVGVLSAVIAGIDWAISNHIDIINLSLTSDEGSVLLEKAIKDAYEKGLLIIAAAGNAKAALPAETDVLFPARYEQVIAVGSIDKQNHKSTFSYFGPSLDFVAPGEKIYSTFNQFDYEYISGTSMAAPFVTATAALYKQIYPKLTNKELRQMLEQTALDLGPLGKDTEYGYGLIQAPTITKLFTDVPIQSWYTDEVEYLYNEGIITGYLDGSFLPDQPVSRAEAVTMIGRALKYTEEQRETSFYDVQKSFFASGYIEQASEQQIIKGLPDGGFGPSTSITRGDVATILQRAYQYVATVQAGFLDVPEEKYFYEPINALYTYNITTGYPDQTFRPLNEITRAEFSVLLARALNESFRDRGTGS